jgi:hypothetical protein
VDPDRLRVVGRGPLEEEAGIAAAGTIGKTGPFDQGSLDAPLAEAAEEAHAGDAAADDENLHLFGERTLFPGR